MRSTIVKLYLIKPENNNPNDLLKTKHDEQKNGHQKDYSSTTGLIEIDLIYIIMVPSPVAVNLLINLAEDHDCKVVLPLLVRENFN